MGQNKRMKSGATMLGLAAASASLAQPLAYSIPADHGLKTFNGAAIAGFEKLEKDGLSLMLWNAKTFEIERRIRNMDRDIHSIALSSDGRRALVGHGFGGSSWVGPVPAPYSVDLKNLETGRTERTFTGPQNSITGVWFDPRERLVFARTELNDVFVWEMATGRQLISARAESVAVSGDGKRIAMAAPPGVKVWNDEGTLLLESKFPATRVSLSPNGDRVMMSDSRTRTMKTASLNNNKIVDVPFPAVDAQFGSGDAMIAVTRLAEARGLGGGRTRECLRGGPDAFSQVSVYRGSTLAAEFDFPGALDRYPLLSPDGRRAAVFAVAPEGDSPFSLTLIDLVDAKASARIPFAQPQLMAFSPDSRTICLTSGTDAVVVESATGRVIHRGTLE